MAPRKGIDIQERVTAMSKRADVTERTMRTKHTYTHDKFVSMSLELGMSPGRQHTYEPLQGVR